MDCYPICRGRLVATLAFSFIVSFSYALPEKPSHEGATTAGVSAERERWLQLKEEIAYHDELYYKKAAPEISDAQYDALKRELLRLEKRFGEGSESEAVGDDREGGFSQARHFRPMLSLEKAYSESELVRFHRRIEDAAEGTDVRYLVEPKVDGMAVSALYENGEFVRAVTRGDGFVGEDISANVLVMDGFPLRLAGTLLPERVELRGEIFVSFEDFRRVNEERMAKGEEAFAHPRSLAAGSAKLSGADAVKERRLSIVFFGLGLFEPSENAPSSQAELYHQMAGWGMPILSERLEVEGEDSLLAAVAAMQEKRLSLPFPTDGSVVKVDSFATQRRLGESREAPYWAIAYKAKGALVETRLLGVTFQVGRSGALTPVAELEPVTLAGSEIERASLHNLQEIERLDLRIGDTVFLKKAGEIIPQVVAVDFAKRDPASRPFVRPERCPFCDGELRSEAERAKLFCVSACCPERVKRRLEHLVSPRAIDMDGWGPATIEGLVDSGQVDDIADLYLVDRGMLLALDHIGPTLADRLLEAREASKLRPLWRFVFGLGIPGVGEVSSKEIAASMDGLDDLGHWKDAALGGRQAQALSDYFEIEENRRELERLVELGVCIKSMATIGEAAGRLSGKVFVITGRLDSMTREQAIREIEAAGGIVRRTLTRDCDYLLVGSSPGSKLADAQLRGVQIIEELEFLGLVRP